MNLASAELINELLSRASAGAERGRRALTTARSSTAVRRRRCQCGRCVECRDNARWERIFTEKFADPSYYSLRVPRAASPLTSI
jgi:hypothetical protein